jgi:hypothetical protein
VPKKPAPMLLLGSREADLGSQIQTRNEFHGEEGVPVKGIPLTTTVSRAEFCSILGDADAAAWYWVEKNGEPPTPRLQGRIDPVITVIGKFVDCRLKLTMGTNEVSVKLVAVILAGMSLTPLVGGVALFKFRADFHPTTEDDLRVLEFWLTRKIKIVTELGHVEEVKQKQTELPLPEPADAATDTTPIAADAAERQVERIGTPEEERDRAHQRERDITNQLLADREKDKAKPKRRRRGGDSTDEARPS